MLKVDEILDIGIKESQFLQVLSLYGGLLRKVKEKLLTAVEMSEISD